MDILWLSILLLREFYLHHLSKGSLRRASSLAAMGKGPGWDRRVRPAQAASEICKYGNATHRRNNTNTNFLIGNPTMPYPLLSFCVVGVPWAEKKDVSRCFPISLCVRSTLGGQTNTFVVVGVAIFFMPQHLFVRTWKT